jgi:hypothetical protein
MKNTERAINQLPVVTGGALQKTRKKYVTLAAVDELPIFTV